MSFSKDGRTLVYDSERDGKWQLFTARIKNDDEKSFAYASEIVEEPLYSADGPAQQPVFSPDGKKVAFLENRCELRVIDVDSKAVNTALDGKYNYSYTDGDISFVWSPDSKRLLADYIGIGGWNNTDIAMVKADGSEVIDLTESGYADASPRWALDGKAITYASGRYGMKSHGSWGNEFDVTLMVLDAEAWDKFNMTKEEADALVRERDYQVIEDAGRGYRRVVASPKPVSIVEIQSIRDMVEAGLVVVACGGGGIPVFKTEGHHLKGAAAVIDKDFASEVLAEELNADVLIILTAVEKVAVNFGKPDQKWLDGLTPEEARNYMDEGQFAPGSMLPKVQAAVKFAESRPGRKALITLLEKAKAGIAGETGTTIAL